MENETWFAEENMAPVTQNILRRESLKASKSGLFPVKGIEEHQRTVKNVIYQSDSGSEEGSAHDYSNDITTNTESNVPYPHQSTPVHVNQYSTVTPDYVPPQSWESPQHGFAAAPIMPPSLFSRIAPKPPKNIAQSSLPCVWSYTTERAAGIAPHYTSNFFHRLRERKELKQAQSGKKGRLHGNAPASSLKYQSQSQQQTMMKRSKDTDDELGRRHSLYDQFVLNKHRPLQELSQKRPVRRAQTKLQGKTKAI